MKPNLKAMALASGIILASAGTVDAADPIKIGVLTPLSGTYTVIGQQVKWGLELAAREINASGGVLGRQLVLTYEDSEANPAVATQKAEKLFQVEKVDFLTGTVSSGATLAVGQVAERNDTLMATTVSFSSAITGSKCSPNVFRVNAHAGMQAAALAAWLKQDRASAKVYFMGPDYEMGRNTVAVFKTAATSSGFDEAGEVYAPLGNKDYSNFFGQVRAARPDVIYTSMAGNDAVRLFTQMQEYGVSKGVQVVGSAGTVTPANIEAMGESAEGFVTGVGYSPLIDSAENKAFVEAFRKASEGTDPDLYGADSYGLLFLYKAAAEKAGSIETDKLRKSLEGTEWQTPQGTKKMRAGDHQAEMPMYAVRVENGSFTIASKVPGGDAIGKDDCERF
jgi:branched-chain amino acid transport system substrate-binding protein